MGNVCEEFRLVEAARTTARPVQGHWNQQDAFLCGVLVQQGPDRLRQAASNGSRGWTDPLVLQQMNQPTKTAVKLPEGSRMVIARRCFLAMDADLTGFGVGNKFVAAPCAQRFCERLKCLQALRANWQTGDVGEGGITETTIGGEQRGEETSGDKT